MIQSLWISFHSGAGSNLEFAGVENYVRLINDPDFITAVTNTLIFLLIQVPIMVMLALYLSVVLNRKTLKFKGIFRTIVFLPIVSSLVAYSIVFKNIFDESGIVNQFLVAVGIVDDPIQWLQDPFWAKVLIIIAITWRWTGYNMIFFLAALQNISPTIYEAAELDGASSRRVFFKITIPLLKPVILFTSITSTIGTLQLFDEPMNLTAGGPGNATTTMSQYIYNLSFQYTPDFGYAATVSYAIVVLVVIFSMIQMKVGNKDD